MNINEQKNKFSDWLTTEINQTVKEEFLLLVEKRGSHISNNKTWGNNYCMIVDRE